MSISSTTSFNQYTGNNSTATYSYTFKIFEESDLLVTKMNTSGVETVLALTTDYTVSGEGESSGGSITLVAGNLATGYILTIRRVMDVVQETDIRNQGSYYPAVIEDQLDKMVMIDQQQQNELDRSPKLPESVDPADFDITLPTDMADNPSATIIINATGDGFEIGPTGTEISGAAASAAAAAASAVTAGENATTASRWAKYTAGTVVDATTSVDSLEYSAKEYAQGTQATTGGSSKNWAQQTGADVTGAAANSRSAKSWAQDPNTGATLGGSAKDWAQNTSSTVDGTNYSAKEWAKGTQTRGVASGGSAKDWANYTGGTVDNSEYSAKKYAQDAAASAATAATNAAASQWNDVVFLTFASSPYTIVDNQAGTLFDVDCTGGAVSITLPTIAGLTLSGPWSIGIRKSDSSTNAITVNRASTDTINGSTSKTINKQYVGANFVPDTDTAPDIWTTIDFGLYPTYTASRAIVSDSNGFGTAATTTAAEIGFINGLTSAVQTQLDARVFKSTYTAKGSLLVATAANTPANLAVGSDGQVLLADSTQSTGTKWATLQQGAKNYITYTNFENNATTGWSLGTATLTNAFPSGAPTFGSGASGNLSIAIASSGQLAGTYSLSYVSSAATTAGNFLASDALTIDAEDKAKILQFKFSYSAITNPSNANWSGTTSNSFGVAIYDVTNSAWIQPAGCFNLVQSSGIGIASGTFQTSSNGTSYRLVVYNANATSGAFTMYLDSFSLGPQTLAYGPAMSDWETVTVTSSITTNATTTAKRRRVGDSREYLVTTSFSGASASEGQLIYTIPETIDTTKILNTASGTEILGSAAFYDNAGGSATGRLLGEVRYVSSTTVTVAIMDDASGTAGYIDNVSGSGNYPVVIAASDKVISRFLVPISGFSSNSVQSSDTATNVVYANTYLSANQTGVNPNASYVKVTFDSVAGTNVLGAYDTTNKKYTVAVSGNYQFSCALQFGSANTLANEYDLVLYKNGAFLQYMDRKQPVAGGYLGLSGMIQAEAKAGDYFEIYIYGAGNNSASTLTIAGGSSQSSFSIARLSGPATIAASETVYCKITGNSTLSGTVSTTFAGSSNITWDAAAAFDSHGGYNGTTTYTIPISGVYEIYAQVLQSGTEATDNLVYLALGIDGTADDTSYMRLQNSGLSAVGVVFNTMIKTTAGKALTLRLVSQTTTPTLTASSKAVYWVIKRIGN